MTSVLSLDYEYERPGGDHNCLIMFKCLYHVDAMDLIVFLHLDWVTFPYGLCLGDGFCLYGERSDLTVGMVMVSVTNGLEISLKGKSRLLVQICHLFE